MQHAHNALVGNGGRLLRYTLLCCAALRCTVLWCAVVCCNALQCAALCLTLVLEDRTARSTHLGVEVIQT
jgi:hypothetical protein